MANKLFEAYKNRLALSESFFAKTHAGERMDNSRKMATAICLNNINNFMNEQFDNSVGTQRADLGLWKKFTLNLTTVALPNLIAHELVIVHPMTAMSGYITYVNYTAGTNKGATKQGDLFNNPFKLGDVDVNYTSPLINETHDTTATEASAHAFTLKWAPVATVSAVKIGTTNYTVLTEGSPVAGTSVLADIAAGTITFASNDTAFAEGADVDVLYTYDNIVIPQKDIPTVNFDVQGIPLLAKARRVAIYYSQMAAFQAKTDYGVDLGAQLAEKAVGQLEYEIDTEVTNLLIDNAVADPSLVWSKTLPVGVSKMEHYNGFTEIVEIARQKIYDATKRFAPNWMLISSSVLPVLSFIQGFKAAPAGQINGPYFAGTLNGLKVFVTPNIPVDNFVVGVLGNDMMSAAAVFAPYMAVVPTQLLQYADGGTSQGFSTLYDLKILNPNLLVKGRITA